MIPVFLQNCKRKLLEPRVIFTVWGLFTLVGILIKVTRPSAHYNNFLIFRGVAHHLFAGLPLYGEYPLEYHDVNHYGPFFGMLVAPFSAMPAWLGAALWVAVMSLLLYLAIRRLPLSVQQSSIVLWLTVNSLYSAALLQQFNIATAALLIGALAMICRRKEGWAALLIVVGTFVKIYGVVGLAFFFFVERKGRFIGYLALWSAVALCLPLLVVSPEYLLHQYVAWFMDITQKHGENMFCEYTNISLVGAVRKISGSADYSDLRIILPAMGMFLASFLRIKQFKQVGFQLLTLASVLLCVILFSSGSENSGYVIAMAGVGIWWVSLPRRGWLAWTLLTGVLIADFATNLFPRDFYLQVVHGYALRAIPCTLVWLHCTWTLWTEDFAASPPAKPAEGPVMASCAHPAESENQ